MIPSKSARVWPDYGAQPFQKMKSADKFWRIYKIFYILFKIYLPRRHCENTNKKGPSSTTGPSLSALREGSGHICLQDILAQILIFPDITQMLLHIGPVDHDLRTGHVRRIKGDVR